MTTTRDRTEGTQRLRAGRRGAALVGAALLMAALGSSADAAAPVTPAVTEGSVGVTGAGFGHGVGMSQYGALGMARGGGSAQQILTHYYSGATLGSVRDAVTLRVNVVDRGSSVTLGTTALSGGGRALRLTPTDGKAKPTTVPAGRPVVVTPMDDGRLSAVTTAADGSTTTLTAPGFTVQWSGGRGMAGPAGLLDVTSRTANATTTSGRVRHYRWGSLDLLPVTRTDKDGVNRVRVEGVLALNLHSEYLNGIAEVPASWPSAALQAQAIAARNYALLAYRQGTATVCGGCHLYDDTRSQVYAGWSKEGEPTWGPVWVKAVRATQTGRTNGRAVLYRGTPISTYYSSSSGGRTRASSDAWGRDLPYLRSVADPWSADPSVNPLAHWTRQIPVSRVLGAFGMGDLASLTVTRTESSGAAAVVTAVAGDGSVRTLTGGSFAGRLGLPAAWVNAIKLPQPTTPDGPGPITPPSPGEDPAAAAGTAPGAGPGNGQGPGQGNG